MTNTSFKYQKPFLKWVGGKTQILDDILNKFPKEIENYHEPFVGGGSVLFGLLTLIQEKKIKLNKNIYIYDINNPLINTYKNIKKNKDELFDFIQIIINEYDSLKGNIINRKPKNKTEALTSKESYYYWIRQKYNEIYREKSKSIECSGYFIFLNKTCFRGIYRESKNGFNVPYGHYKKTPSILLRKDLDNISSMLNKVKIKKLDFKESMNRIEPGDFVYIDPPYAPENTKSFVNYNSDGFNLENHLGLFNKIKYLSKNNVKFIMSNSNVDLVNDNFKEFKIDKVIARRAINSKKPQSKTTEVIIYNF